MMVLAAKKARLKWQCRRGMLELDLLLQDFVERQLNNLSEQALQTLEDLLNTPDPLLYDWLMGRQTPEDKELSALVAIIKQKHTIT